jgi:hypothetical protein
MVRLQSSAVYTSSPSGKGQLKKKRRRTVRGLTGLEAVNDEFDDVVEEMSSRKVSAAWGADEVAEDTTEAWGHGQDAAVVTRVQRIAQDVARARRSWDHDLFFSVVLDREGGASE